MPAGLSAGTIESSIPNSAGGIGGRVLAVEALRLLLGVRGGAKRDQITLARITSAPSAFASSRDCAWAAGPESSIKVSPSISDC